VNEQLPFTLFNMETTMIRFSIGDFPTRPVREIFEQLRREQPTIVLPPDDIVSVRPDSEVSPERERILNELLAQMDAIQTRTDIIVLASTNRLEDLDTVIRDRLNRRSGNEPRR
jgi:transitional endoplasmic reticulum ATPase